MKREENVTIVKNKAAFFNFEITNRLEAGIVLCGSEVKSIKSGKVSIKEAYGKFIDNELYIVNMNISEYKNSNIFNHDPDKNRKLLLNKKELKTLRTKVEIAGYTIAVLSVYQKKHLIKIEIGLAKGKKDFDKRESIKKNDSDREIARIMKDVNKRKF